MYNSPGTFYVPAYGRLPERPKGADCKSAGIAFIGSNPIPATHDAPPLLWWGAVFAEILSTGVQYAVVAPIAQSAERFHGKEKVKGSIPFWGSSAGESPYRGGVAQLVRAHDS